ncbi:MAG: hypothetical protein K5905_09910 [Roseibium sp.]|uniref:hypothetical protein n=1 Tax=Roseibium sp. TaxID=1936156 RepID=UPI00260E3954|nr:hypothetical protein [Roseibium sp.]MCV0425778.1 hypothetical protein [Roseibium sp.]
MSDFTVAEGDKEQAEWELQIAKSRFEQLFIAMFRAVTRGENSYDATQALFSFVEHAKETKVPVAKVVDEATKSLYERAFGTERKMAYESEQQEIVHDALLVAAEYFSTDNMARARLSKRQQGLDQSIEAHIHGKERRSREHGHSYIKRLLKEADLLSEAKGREK